MREAFGCVGLLHGMKWSEKILGRTSLVNEGQIGMKRCVGGRVGCEVWVCWLE
ncbi:hypothetical protein [Bartonella tribocorum]|uniref:hypothetical protein n=1 Tax=Bartonella tribocorum TaxID=85701 RepID=UPI001ABAD744|nr:hypothetical protein [Bartonella tribocorum]